MLYELQNFINFVTLIYDKIIHLMIDIIIFYNKSLQLYRIHIVHTLREVCAIKFPIILLLKSTYRFWLAYISLYNLLDGIGNVWVSQLDHVDHIYEIRYESHFNN